MKKTMKRGIAKAMYEALATLPLGHLTTEDLEKVMDNIVALSAPYEQYDKLMKELGKRLYDGIDEEEIRKFNAMLSLASKAEDIAKAAEIHKAIKAEYGELYELFQKQNKVDASLREKEIEVELSEVDRKAFTKAILKGKPDIAIAAFDLFAPMFISEDKAEVKDDFSELDELLTL